MNAQFDNDEDRYLPMSADSKRPTAKQKKVEYVRT